MNPESTPVPAAPTDPVEEAMAGVRGLDSVPTAAHVAVFERVHVVLTDALAAIDGV